MIRRHELPLWTTGFMATLSGIGLARFAYTALMPYMVQAQWFAPEQLAYLGAANLLGYLIGALAATPLARRFGALRVLVLCWITVALSFAACALPLSVAWFFVWRCLSGVGGAILMVLGVSVAMAAAAPGRRAFLGPLMFCGIGCGALLSATVIPALAEQHLALAWCALALCAALAAGLGWRSAALEEKSRAQPVPQAQAASFSAATPLWTTAVLMATLAYMCDGFGYVPHTVFWVDYLARELHQGTAYASLQWGFFGLGALVGPLSLAFIATRWGWWRSCCATYGIKALAIALPLLSASFGLHALSSLLVGALSPGLSAVTSGYLMQLVGTQRHKTMWGYATAAFALVQALAGYGMAWLYAQWGQYRPLFFMGALALTLGCLLMLASAGVRRSAPLSQEMS